MVSMRVQGTGTWDSKRSSAKPHCPSRKWYVREELPTLRLEDPIHRVPGAPWGGPDHRFLCIGF